jgi:hypothetical protein
MEAKESRMAEEQTEGAGAEATEKKAKRAGEKSRRSHGDRALASLRAAKRGQREVSEPAERAQLMLAEANVLALLDVADALGGSSSNSE